MQFAIIGWINRACCFSQLKYNRRSIVSVSGFCKTAQYHQSITLSKLTSSSSSDNEDQHGMKDAFDSLNALSPEDVAPAWKIKPKILMKYSRTDDTQAFYYGKSSDDEVAHYLEMQQELEEDVSNTKEVSECNQKKDIMSDLFQEDEDDPLQFGADAQHPWSSINPILRLRGPIATGYGRGGKKLGVPTANLPSSLFQSALESVDAGVYFGWAVIEGDDSKIKNRPIKAVVNVGYSPTFEGKENKEKIVEAHLITKASPMTKYEGNSHNNADEIDKSPEEVEINEDFYGETMRIQLIGFLRPEQKFDSFPDLIAQIHRDIGHAASALNSFPYVFSRDDEFISNSSKGIWIGSDGGNDNASWEYEVW
jgi:riboflavin kinase